MVVDSYNKWVAHEILARNYVSYIASAMKIYIEHHHPSIDLDDNKSPEELIYIYKEWAFKAPFLSQHIGTASVVAESLWLMQPGLERMRLAWLVASKKSFGKNFIKEDGLTELRDKVLSRGKDLPAICNPWI